MTKEALLAVIGAVGSFLAGFFGGWTTSLTTLCMLMAIDYITGVVLALVWHKSAKSADGTYNSNIGAKGLFKKFMIILVVFIAHRMDIALGFNYLRDGVAIAFIINETMSIIENAGLMGVPIPDVLVQGISVLKNRNDGIMEKKESENP